MPTCRDMSELVTDYIEHATPLRVRAAIWWHLLRCEACRHYFDQMRQTVRVLRGYTGRLPAANEEAVLAAVRDERNNRTR